VTEVIKAEAPGAPGRAAGVLESGGVIVYPTETLYGIGVLVTSAAAVERIFDIKGRPKAMPIPVLVRDLEMAKSIAEPTPAAERLAERFWPGALTIILKVSGELDPIITAGTGNVAVRVSSHPFVKALFECIDIPLTSTSANPSGAGNILESDYIYDAFRDRVELIIDSGNIPASKGSTIVDLTAASPRIVREGDLSSRELEEYL
jgi:L-threonylcarbamoyladenylate synthase